MRERKPEEGKDDTLLSLLLDREKSKRTPSSPNPFSDIIKIVLLSYSLTLISKTPSPRTEELPLNRMVL